MRDAIALGIGKMLALHLVFANEGLIGDFKFVHVVLTDGEDNRSDISLNDLNGKLSHLSSKLPPGFLKNIFIGVGVEGQTKSELQGLAESTDGEFYDVKNSEIENIFQKISLSLGIVHRQMILGVQHDSHTDVIEANQVQL
jgi:uncharacterized protein YegL